MIAKRVYVGECAGSNSVDKPWKRWIKKDHLTKLGLNIRQTRRKVHDRSIWWGLAMGNM